MKDENAFLIMGAILGASLASLGWLCYIDYIRHEAVDHGAAQYVCGRYGGEAKFRWAQPKIIVNDR